MAAYSFDTDQIRFGFELYTFRTKTVLKLAESTFLVQQNPQNQPGC